MTKHINCSRPFAKMSWPGRHYAVYEPREGYDELKARRAYVAVHKQQPAEVIWARPGFWLAGPVPEPLYLVGVEPKQGIDEPNEQEESFWAEREGEHKDNPFYDYNEAEPEIETTALAGEQGRLF